jgi:hypothetical protein
VFRDRNGIVYRVSFQVAEEGTWDHQFHDVLGHLIQPDDLWLMHYDLTTIQTLCDEAVGRELHAMNGPNEAVHYPPARRSSSAVPRPFANVVVPFRLADARNASAFD